MGIWRLSPSHARLSIKANGPRAKNALRGKIMKQRIAHVTILVRDYDEAIAYYTKTIGFTLVEDTPVAEGKRWVLVAPDGGLGCGLLLAKAKNAEELGAVGRQAGGRVFLFLHTDDFSRDYRALAARGVRFCEPPRDEPYGMVAVFTDLYGNRWDLLELKKDPRS
jgi:catechol 2,3-dioxygenase-like lactoylglutathione lyase family enzyme